MEQSWQWWVSGGGMEGWARADCCAQEKLHLGWSFCDASAEGEYQGLAIDVNSFYEQSWILLFAIFNDATFSGVLTN